MPKKQFNTTPQAMTQEVFYQRVAFHLEDLGHVAEIDITNRLFVDGLLIDNYRCRKDNRRLWRVRYGSQNLARGLKDGEDAAKRLARAIHEDMGAIRVQAERAAINEAKRQAAAAAVERAKAIEVQAHDMGHSYAYDSTGAPARIYITLLNSYQNCGLVVEASRATPEMLERAKLVRDQIMTLLAELKSTYEYDPNPKKE